MSEPDENLFLARLRAGDEAAFRELLETHHGALLRLARTFIKESASAEEIVQGTWLAVLEGLDGFEGRFALKSWIFSILANQARTRAVRDGRIVLFMGTWTIFSHLVDHRVRRAINGTHAYRQTVPWLNHLAYG